MLPLVSHIGPHRRGAVAEFTLTHAGHVYLVEDRALAAAKAGQPYACFGRRWARGVHRLRIPHTGRWHLLSDVRLSGIAVLRPARRARARLTPSAGAEA